MRADIFYLAKYETTFFQYKSLQLVYSNFEVFTVVRRIQFPVIWLLLPVSPASGQSCFRLLGDRFRQELWQKFQKSIQYIAPLNMIIQHISYKQEQPFKENRTWDMEQGTWKKDQGTWNKEQGTRNMEQGTWNKYIAWHKEH